MHKLLLEQEGAKVDTASNGKEALEMCKEISYNLILMDIHMPEMDGFTCAKLIREWEAENKKKKVDIYFVTGEYFSEEEVLSKFKGVAGEHSGVRSLRKPLDVEIIRKAIALYRTT